MMRLSFLCLLATIFTLAAAENIKSVGGVAKARIKSITGVAEANIKSMEGVDNTASGGGGSPDVERSATNSYVTPAVALFTNSVTIAGSNPLLYVYVGIGDADPTGNRPTAITWGAASLTEQWATNNGTGPLFVRSSGWTLQAPGTGTQSLIVVLNSTTADQVHIHWVVITNAHQTAAISGVATASGSSAAPSVTVASAVNSLVVSGVTSDGENSLAVGAGPTLVSVLLNIQTDTDSGTSKRAGGASIAMPWTTANQPWAIGGMSIAPP